MVMFGSRSGSKSAVADTSALEDVFAIRAVVAALAGARGTREAVESALEAIRSAFGWAYGSYWIVDHDAQTLRFSLESGQVNPEFEQVTRTASFREGVGLAGCAWRARELVFVSDLGEVADCVRAPVARKAGVRSGLCFPILDTGRVVATMDFFATETIELAESRRIALAAVAELVSQTVERLRRSEDAITESTDNRAILDALRMLAVCTDETEAFSKALGSFRTEFGWAYGSVWKLGADHTLRFDQQSGEVNPEFEAVTMSASFAEGVGLAGRAWRARELVFVSDLAEVTDCVRAPVARRAGVKSGVCLPIVVDGAVAATMDFFTLEKIELSASRRAALSSVADLLGQTISRLRQADEIQQSAAELSESVAEVSRNAQQATDVANEAVVSAEATMSTISALTAASTAIGALTKVITGIAAQTNLLALNATIEAARAGEAGRGFAVVANEVKQLATETAHATGDVTRQVEAIQDASNAVSQSVSGIATQIQGISEIQTEISSVLEEQSTIAQRFRV